MYFYIRKMKSLWILFLIFYQLGSTDMNYELKTEILRRLECSLGNDDCDCAVNGGWSNWDSWSPCTGECGQVGVRQRVRQCSNPVPSFGGENCLGLPRVAIDCRMPGCTEDEYRDITKCDPLRNAEFQVLQSIHKRTPALSERCLVAECHYSLVQNILGKKAERYWNALHCVKHNNGCPVLGGWSQWGKWSECSAEYGVGKQIRCRTCDSPIPTNPKLDCKGLNCTIEPCQGPCFKEPKQEMGAEGGVWGLWSPWSKCTVTCSQGMRKRIRFCIKEVDLITPFYIESTTETCSPWWGSRFYKMSLMKRTVEVHSFCSGPHSEIEPCYLSSCAVDGGWSEWEPWSQCSKACGIGVQSRSRACSSPPSSNAGSKCSGPYSWFRHCYLEPCQESDHEVATFSGNGALYYRKTAHATRILHLYVKFKPFSLNGDIILRTSTSNHAELRNEVRLSLAAGYIVFTASLGHCHLAVISHGTVKIKKWLQILIMLTGNGVTMRIDDSEKYYKASFSCVPRLLNFDSEMVVGGNYSGQLQKLYVNFLHRQMKSMLQQVAEKKYVFPSSVSNVIYENLDSEEGRSLNDLIFIPCGTGLHMSVELVVKTTSQDGFLMLLKDFYGTKFLILSFEPGRVLLQLVMNDCVYKSFQPIEDHVGKWTYVAVDFNKDRNWGFTVNGGIRKAIEIYDENMLISCVGYILVGNVIKAINMLEEKSVLEANGIYFRSITGILSHAKVNNKIMDISSLPTIVERGATPFTSESTSNTDQYDETELVYGQSMNLICYYDMQTNKEKNIYSSIFGSINGPLWINFDTPITPNETKLTDQDGISFKIYDDGEVIRLETLQYSSREEIEGFYSCWIPNPINNSNIILTYGVSVVDTDYEFSSFSKSILKIASYFFLILYTTTMSWLLFECEESYRSWNGVFTTTSIVKRLRNTEFCEITHDHSFNFILGLKNKLMEKRNILGFKYRKRTK